MRIFERQFVAEMAGKWARLKVVWAGRLTGARKQRHWIIARTHSLLSTRFVAGCVRFFSHRHLLRLHPFNRVRNEWRVCTVWYCMPNWLWLICLNPFTWESIGYICNLSAVLRNHLRSTCKHWIYFMNKQQMSPFNTIIQNEYVFSSQKKTA